MKASLFSMMMDEPFLMKFLMTGMEFYIISMLSPLLIELRMTFCLSVMGRLSMAAHIGLGIPTTL